MQQINTDAWQHDVRTTLYQRYASTILAYVCQQVASRQDAEDLLVEVFMAAHTNASLSTLSEERQLAWLRRVARNKVIDRYRHAALLTTLPLEQIVTRALAGPEAGTGATEPATDDHAAGLGTVRSS